MGKSRIPFSSRWGEETREGCRGQETKGEPDWAIVGGDLNCRAIERPTWGIRTTAGTVRTKSQPGFVLDLTSSSIQMCLPFPEEKKLNPYR